MNGGSLLGISLLLLFLWTAGLPTVATLLIGIGVLVYAALSKE